MSFLSGTLSRSRSRSKEKKNKTLLKLTTIPMSCFILSSTAPSSTMFMNWSKPRSVPVTARLALRATAVSFFLEECFLS